jgi:phosphatidylglycerophosphate synthase
MFSGYLFAQGDPYLANYAAVIFIIAAFLDHVDGEFARIVEKTSDFGHYYDHFAVCVTYVSLFIGIGIGKSYGVLGNNAIFFGFAASIAIAIIIIFHLGFPYKDGYS